MMKKCRSCVGLEKQVGQLEIFFVKNSAEFVRHIPANPDIGGHYSKYQQSRSLADLTNR